ncbi:uncharacterized protein IL334_005423 [Kwoniella shivajii]|uniref:NADAR domain-containing protein n=1 Tax=Kwoniella shivajii TaxID=564305 RepID=A0ABZ1D4E4_9TREE|nr:hypothetical protein IL334_005423 [Kwoniella shivajii]
MSNERRDPYLNHPYILFYYWKVTSSNPFHLACMSQWFAKTFVDPNHPNVTFKTAEHYMMYHKALIFDPEVADDIVNAPTPEEAKERGRKIRNFDRKKWDETSDDVVERGNYLKFGQNEELLRVILGTRRKTLIEASPTDRIWGIGFGVDDAKGKEQEWGSNRMGLALTRARDRLVKEHGQDFTAQVD